MKYSFHPSAIDELNDSVNYYENCKTGLGFDFLKEVYATIQRIIQFPGSWPKISKNTCRCLINRFPYGIIYQVLENEIVIIAIMHVKRKPGYWKERK